MGGTEHQRTSRGDQPRRRFVTRAEVEDAAAAGRALRLGPRDVVTHEAAQRARDLGVALEREGGRAAAPAATPTATAARPAPPAPEPPGALRAAVRRAVVAELGHEPPGLDAAIDRVFADPTTR